MCTTMSRKQRVWFPGAIYHITSRGNRKAAIFSDKYDHLKYLDILDETRGKYPFVLHTYCLMTNHTHLLLETIEHHPKDIMKMLNSRYAMYFNKRHDLTGHVFQGRYGSEMITSTKYLLEVSRYIHLNPVKANIVHSPKEYPWSSYSSYISTRVNPHIKTDCILSHFQEPQKQTYKQFVESP
jgi:putative transposase